MKKPLPDKEIWLTIEEVIPLLMGPRQCSGNELVEITYYACEALYLRGERKSPRGCVDLALKSAAECFPDRVKELPAKEYFLKRLKSAVPEEVIYYYRYGVEAFVKKYCKVIDEEVA